MRPIRIAVVLSHPIPQFSVLYRELAILPEVELRVFYCCDWGSKSYHDPLFGISIAWDAPLTDGHSHTMLPIRKRPTRLSYWEVDNPSVSRELHAFGPDIVQLNGYAHRTNWRVAAWAKKNRKPLLLFSDSKPGNPEKWWKRLLKPQVVSSFYRKVDGAFFVGDQNHAYHLGFGMPTDRLFPIGFPIDRDGLLNSVPDPVKARRAVRELHHIPVDAFVALFCGKLVPHKRPIDLAKAVQHATGCSRPIWALFVGEGPQRQELAQLIEATQTTNIVLAGFVNQSTIGRYFAAADCLALMSEREPFGLVVPEAATFGKPAVVSDVVGCVGPNSSARPGINALVYPCGDWRSLGKSLVTLATDVRAYATMSQAALDLSREHSPTVAAQAYLAGAKQLAYLGKR